MASNKLWILMAFAMVLTACQPAKNQRTSLGGAGRGRPSLDTAAYNSAIDDKPPGSVTSNAGDQTFDMELQNFTSPVLSGYGAADQMGFVSSSINQSTGVIFRGNAVTAGSANSYTRTFDPSTMAIQFLIYDDRTGQVASDGSKRPPIMVAIGPDRDGFVSASGTLSGSTVNLFFQDQWGSIAMNGTITGQAFSGTVSYCNGSTAACASSGSGRTLGQFTVNACGFFHCENN